MVIDVSGDTDVSIANVGLAPVHAVQQSASEVLVVNHSVTGAAADSLTKLNFSSTTIFSTNTISLPPNSAPNFVATTESSQAYVLMPNYLDPTTDIVVPSMPSGQHHQPITSWLPFRWGTTRSPWRRRRIARSSTWPTRATARSAASTPSGGHLFPADRQRFVRIGPLWLTARSDSQRLYVLNGNGVVSTVDTTSTVGPDTLIDASDQCARRRLMIYDGNLNRLYIPGGSQLTILDVSQSVPAVLAGGRSRLRLASPSSVHSTVAPICAAPRILARTTSPQALTVVAVAALPDGSRAYVGSLLRRLRIR